MKTFIAFSLFLLGSLGPLLAARDLSYDALPPSIKKTIDAQNLDRDNVTARQAVEKGRVVYKVQVKQAGRNPEIWIASDGQIVNDSRAGGPDAQARKAQTEIQSALGKGKKLRIGDTPVAVQNAVKSELGPIEGPAKNSEVTVAEQGGQKVYHIDYKGRGGRRGKITVSEEGRILRSDKRLASAQKQTVTQPGDRFVQLNDLPAEARKTVQREARDAQVGQIEIESAEARNIFKVELNQGGQSRYIWVEADGRILKQTEAAGAGKK